MIVQLTRILAIVALAGSVLVSPIANAGDVLWGTSSSGTNPSSVFTIDAATGAATLVGSTGLGNKASAIAVDPADGKLYAILGSACSGARLITIDPSTGAGTLVGVLTGPGFDGTSTNRCDGGSDALVFGSDGTLYAGGWNGGTTGGGKLLTIDKNTGGVLTNKITDPAGPFQGAHIAGLAAAADGTLWVSRGNNTAGFLHTIDPTTGGFISTLTLSDPLAVLSDIAFASDGTLYASMPNTGQLVTVDTVTGVVSPIGPFGGGEKISGLAFLVVEVPAEDCTFDAGGCNPTGAQTIVLPPTVVIPAGATITQTGLRLTDTRVVDGTCGSAALTVDIPDTVDDLFFPPFLCGSPDFVVLITEAAGIEFLDGIVAVENDPGVFFANPLPCDLPPPSGVELQQQDVVVWQPTEVATVLEERALELTNGCGSSRGSTRGLSYFVVGMHIDFGIPDTPSNAEAIEQAFIGLTRTKLENLLLALEKAEPAFMKASDFRKMKNMAKNALKALNAGAYGDSLNLQKNFLKFLERADLDTTLEFNNFGNLRMRIGNTIFMTEVKVIPFAP